MSQELSEILAEAADRIQQTEPPKSLPFNKTQFEVFAAILAHMINDAAKQAARLFLDEGGNQSFWSGGSFPLSSCEDDDDEHTVSATIQILSQGMKELGKLQEAVPTLIQYMQKIEENRYPDGAPWAQEEEENPEG